MFFPWCRSRRCGLSRRPAVFGGRRHLRSGGRHRAEAPSGAVRQARTCAALKCQILQVSDPAGCISVSRLCGMSVFWGHDVDTSVAGSFEARSQQHISRQGTRTSNYLIHLNIPPPAAQLWVSSVWTAGSHWRRRSDTSCRGPMNNLSLCGGIGIFETPFSLEQGVAGGSSDGAAAPAGAAGVAAGRSFGGSGKAVRPRGGDGAARRRLGAAPPPHAPAAGGAPLTYGPHCQTLPALDEITAQAVRCRP